MTVQMNTYYVCTAVAWAEVSEDVRRHAAQNSLRELRERGRVQSQLLHDVQAKPLLWPRENENTARLVQMPGQ